MKHGPTPAMSTSGLFARIEKAEGINELLELALYRSKAEVDQGNPLLLIELSNTQIGELMVVYKIKVVIVDSDRRAVA